MTMTTEQSAASDGRWVAEIRDGRGYGAETIPFRFDGDLDGATQYAQDRFEEGLDEVVLVQTLDDWFALRSSQQEADNDE